jgi:hypothetical protein
MWRQAVPPTLSSHLPDATVTPSSCRATTLSGHYNPQVAAKFGIVDFDWSNEKDEWINDSPMTCKERLLEQARVIKAINTLGVPRVCGSTAVVH